MTIPKHLILIIIVMLGLGVWFGVVSQSGTQSESPYVAVYLATGDIYFGKLSWFPWPRLVNVWLLQRGVDAENRPQFSIAPFTGAFWGPVDEINLNLKEVVFWTRLRKDSQVARAFANPSLLRQLTPQQPPATEVPQPNVTSTFRGPTSSPPGH